MAEQPMVILRNIANQAGQNVDWDSKTGNVSVGGSSYTPNQLREMGGQLVDNQWTMPSYVANNMLSNSPQSTQITNQRRQTQLDNMYSMMGAMSDSYLSEQRASLESARDNQLSALQKAYATAVSDGQISIRDAESAYEEQAKAINEQAYLDSQQTALYGQDMGIQNSQQMVGLMQGDNARKNSLINTNMTTRDKRVADIRDRLTALKTQKNLDMANVHAQYDSALAQAQAQANQMQSNNIFGVMSNDYYAQRDQDYNKQNMLFSNDLQMGQMAQQQKYNQINMDTNFQNTLKQMEVAQGFDLEKMSVQLANDMKKMSTQYGYSSALQSQSAKQQIANAQNEYIMKLKQEEDKYQIQLERDLRGVTPGTKEYEVITKTAENNLKQSVSNIHAETVYKYSLENTLNAPNEATLTAPKDWTSGGRFTDFISKGLNSMTNYDDKLSAYNAEQDAIARKQAMLQSGNKYLPWQ